MMFYGQLFRWLSAPVLNETVFCLSWKVNILHLHRFCAKGTVSPEPSLFAHMKYGSRRRVWQNNQTSSPTWWQRICVWRTSLRRTKSTIISWAGSNYTTFTLYNRFILPVHSKIIIEPCHKIMVLFILCNLIFQMCSHPVVLDVLIFGWTLCLLPYFMCGNSEGSGGTVQARLSLRWSPMW